MKKVVKYQSILGMQFDTPREALEDENRLPSIIKTYEDDLVRMKETGRFAAKPVDDELMRNWVVAIAGYKEQWETVKEQRMM